MSIFPLGLIYCDSDVLYIVEAVPGHKNGYVPGECS
jgi:hypothetical protein